MKKDPQVFLKHILESIDLAEQYISKTTRKAFLKSPQLQDAVIRRIEIMGEAAKNIPDDFKEKYHDVPWHKVEGMRNVLIHGYFGIDIELVWNVVNKDLPVFKKQIEDLLK